MDWRKIGICVAVAAAGVVCPGCFRTGKGQITANPPDADEPPAITYEQARARPDVAAAFPGPARDILEKADSFELLSLYPFTNAEEAVTSEERFHGFPVLGKTPISDPAARRAFLTALYSDIFQEGILFTCFVPRHGIRATMDGRSVDVVYCYECLRMIVYYPGGQSEALIRHSSREISNRILKDAGVPLSDK